MLVLSVILFVISVIILSVILFIIIKEKLTSKNHEKDILTNINEERKKFKTMAHWYKSILDAIPMPITVTDADACWTFVNSRVEDFLGVKFEEIKGKPCSNWGAHICNTPNCGIECAKRGIKQTFFTHNNASYKVNVEILKDINGETAGYIEIVQDITHIEEMANRQMEAEAISKAKSSFIATMSHEIRTPLNAIIGITDIQIQDQTLSQSAKEALVKIHNSGDLLLHIINDILDLSKIEAGKFVLTPASYEFPSVINDVVHLNIMRINNKPIKFDLRLDEEIPLNLYGDEIRIKQILNNVLSNAFKYTDSGNVTLTVNVHQKIRDECMNETICLIDFIVTDTGQGMTEEEVNNLFNEYSRFNLETNRKTEGTGLGMSITKHLVHLMRGSINVESAPEKGTTISIRLPQKQIDNEIIGKEHVENLQKLRYDSSPLFKKSQIVREPMPYGKVLVVDDVDTNLFVARGLLSSYDLNIELVNSGYDTIEKITEGKIYDIIFMDHMMPKMDGVETTKIIRTMGYTHPIVALTANAVVGQSDIFLQNGFDDYISKPIDIRQLNSTLNRLIRDKQPQNIIDEARLKKTESLKNQLNNTSDMQKNISSEIKKIFIQDAKNITNSIISIIENNFGRHDDLQTFTIKIHAIKSALANIGEKNTSSIAAMLEDAGRESNINLLLTETPKFLDVLENVIKNITPEKKENNTETTINDLNEKLQIILKACADIDKKTVKKVLNDLKEKTWTNEINETLDQISLALLHSDFEKITALASALK